VAFIANTPADQAEMLAAIGVAEIAELFADIPASLRLTRELNLPAPEAEPILLKNLKSLAARNISAGEAVVFLGAGTYDHYVPSVVGHILGRSEFYTAYTPYQAEISQGTLQAIYEYQTMICNLTGLDVSNASLYDGATAVVEAVLMATGATRRCKVVVSAGLNPEYRRVLATYCDFLDLQLVVGPLSEGEPSAEQLHDLVD